MMFYVYSGLDFKRSAIGVTPDWGQNMDQRNINSGTKDSLT